MSSRGDGPALVLSRTSFSRREVTVTMLDLLFLILISSRLEAWVLRLSWSVSTVFCTVVHVHLCICTTVAVVYSTLFFECIDRVVLGRSLFLL